MATIRTALLDWRKYLIGVFTQLIGNPVIGRELRVRVRVGRGYLLQAFYLAFMILVVALIYHAAITENPDLTNPVRVQSALVEFYRVVIIMLTALIVLIAPALTANAITLERERKTIDLLLATPLTARQLLVGKLMGSFAFILLLLALTLPVNAVSVMLGGVSFPDLLKAYLLIASGGLVLCAIALFTSVYARNSTLAVLWSYLRVGGFLLVTQALFALQRAVAVAGGGFAPQLEVPIALLNPFTAPFVADMEVNFIHWRAPAWVVGVVLCLLLTRLILTLAARGVGLYDKDVLPSVRRQVLVLMPLAVLISVLPMLAFAGGFPFPPSSTHVLALVVICFAPFLMLTVWIAPFGQHEDIPCPDDGIFKPLRMFQPSPAGVLPFLTTTWGLMVGALALALYWAGVRPKIDDPLFSYLTSLLVYLTGLWMLFWGIGRICSSCTGARSLITARALTLAAITAIVTLPLIIDFLLLSTATEYFAIDAWVFKPLFDLLTSPESREVHTQLYLWGSGMAVVALLLGIVCRGRRVAGTETLSNGV